MIEQIDQCCANGARLEKACQVVGLSPRSLQRWRDGDGIREDGRKAAALRRRPANALTPTEREQLLAVANRPEFADRTPHQIVPALADHGIYLASESTFYRVLREEKQLAHRGRAKAPVRKRPQPLKATAPNQVWTWDITYLPTAVKGVFLYLYLIIDLYSRKVVGWEVYLEQTSEQAADVISKAWLRENVVGKPLVLHSDNGTPMKGATMLAMLQKLGVVPSFSRPSVSNDNPYSEAMFRTLKYCPEYPEKPFDDIIQARSWVTEFSGWYNERHLHSAIQFVTPGQRHRGEDKAILPLRQALYEAAKANNPERWSGETRNWEYVSTVYLNPTKAEGGNARK